MDLIQHSWLLILWQILQIIIIVVVLYYIIKLYKAILKYVTRFDHDDELYR